MPLSEADFRRPKNAAALVRAIRGLTSPAKPLRIMEYLNYNFLGNELSLLDHA